MLISDQSKIIEQAKLTYFPLRKALGKQLKTIEGQGRKQIESQQDLKSNEGLFPKEMKTNEYKYELDDVTRWDKNF